MMKKILFLIILCGVCFAENPILYQSVNVITGEYCEATVDLTHPFQIKRCFGKKGWISNFPELYPKGQEIREVPGSAGQTLTVRYHHEGEALLIDSVAAPGKPFCEYQYSPQMWITRRSESNGRYLINEYDEEGKVKCQKAPAGSDDAPVAVASFTYKEKATEVADALGQKNIYCYTDEGQLSAIETYAENGLYRKKRFFWKENRLVCEAVEDSSGRLDHAIASEYDKKGRLIKQTLYGTLTGTVQAPIVLNEEGMPEQNGVESFSKWFAYSDETSLVLREGDDSGVETRFVYEPITNWRIAEFVCEGEQVRMRTFYKYNEFGHLLEAAVDNGVSESEKDLSGVTERKIIRHKLVEDSDSAAFGKPLFVEQRYLNLSTGKEEIFSRTINHYNNQGALIQTDVLNNDFSVQNSESFQHSDEGKLIGSSKSNGSSATSTYDENGNVIAASDGESQSRMRYDLMNRLIGLEKWSGDGQYLSESYRYDAASNRIETTDTFGRTTTYGYDALNRLTKTVLPALKNGNGQEYAPVIAFEYDIQDRCTASTNAGGEKTVKSYNVRGQPLIVTYPDGTKELFEYNLDGTLCKSVDAKGVATCYEYDYLKRKTSVQVYAKSGRFDHETKFHYNTFHLISTSGKEGSSLSIQYNDAGQQKVLSQENGLEIEYLYDKKGCVIGAKEWYGEQSDEYRKTYAVRDEANQIKEIRIEDAAGRVQKQMIPGRREKESRRSYLYDGVNEEGQNVLTTKETDAQGITTVVTYDALSREDSILKLDPYGALLQKRKIFYDASGNKMREVHTVATPEGGAYAYITQCEWGPNHKLLAMTEAYGSAKQQSTSYFYNACGQLITTLKPDGIQLYYAYDDMGRLNRLSSSDGTIDYSLERDAEGRICEVFDALSNSSASKVFDGAGRVVEETLGNGLTLKHEYDRLGRKTLLALPDNSSIAYEYDAAFLRAVHRYSADQEKLYTHEYAAYDAEGRLTQENLIGSCGAVHYERDEKGRCTEVKSPYWKQTLQGFDQSGNLAQMSVEDPLGIEETSYSYDGVNRLTGEGEACFEYDSLENRCAKNGALYEIDTLNQLLQAEDASYQYDGNGNMIKKETGHHQYQYSYDALNRLATVVIDENQEVRYTYDIFNRRLSKQVSLWDEGEWKAQGLLRFIYDGDCEIGAVDEAGKTLELRVLGIGRGAEIGAACAIELGAQVFAPLHDQMGSVRCLVDMEGKKVAEFYRFSAFGEEELFDADGEELPAAGNPWRYMSKRFDPETGFIFFGKRHYEPKSGRFTTKDPMQFIDGPNRYAYVHNNPLSNRDLYGHYSLCDLWDDTYSTVVDAYERAYEMSNQWFQALQRKVDFLNLMREHIDLYSQGLVGDLLFVLTGYDAGEAEQGVYGEGEINNHVRITWINGILNLRPLFMDTVKQFSESHGGNNIHYVFRPTEGWGRDLMAAVVSILGFTSPDAKRLAHTWRDLIAEMGGVDGEGIIIHYAHSIGGTETNAALHLMSPEERRRIRVISFGSATMIGGHGLEGAHNYLSRRDFMGYVHLFEAYIFSEYQITYVGSYFGILPPPLFDHLLKMDTYAQVIDEIGRAFVAKYGSHYDKR